MVAARSTSRLALPDSLSYQPRTFNEVSVGHGELRVEHAREGRADDVRRHKGFVRVLKQPGQSTGFSGRLVGVLDLGDGGCGPCVGHQIGNRRVRYWHTERQTVERS